MSKVQLHRIGNIVTGNIEYLALLQGLIKASKNGDLEVVRLVLDNGVKCTDFNNEAIREASSNGHVEVVRLLLKHGADCTDFNNEAIRAASRNGHIEVVELLKEHGAVL